MVPFGPAANEAPLVADAISPEIGRCISAQFGGEASF